MTKTILNRNNVQRNTNQHQKKLISNCSHIMLIMESNEKNRKTLDEQPIAL